MRIHAAQELRFVNATPRAGSFSRIEDAIAAIRAGQMVIVADDEDRENEGDLTMAAEKITPEAINFMAKYGRGLICLAMTPERLDELQIPLMVSNNSSRFETAFCVSIEAGGVRRPESRLRIVRLRCSRPSTQPRNLPILSGRGTYSRCVRGTPESWNAPVKRKLLWTWPDWPAFLLPALSARS
jgi:hypothetical protein